MKSVVLKTDEVVKIIIKEKTKILRPIKNIPSNTYRITYVDENEWDANFGLISPEGCYDLFEEIKPPYKFDQLLYVKETWSISNMDAEDNSIYFIYKAGKDERDYIKEVTVSDEQYLKYNEKMTGDMPEWFSPVSMPKEAARIYLKVLNVFPEKIENDWYWVIELGII
jgi:hypothetical protein